MQITLHSQADQGLVYWFSTLNVTDWHLLLIVKSFLIAFVSIYLVCYFLFIILV